MQPYYQDSHVAIYHGDCREIVPLLGRFDLLLTDPPYGIARFRKRLGYTKFKGSGFETRGIEWDVAPDEVWISTLLEVAKFAVVWGMNNIPLPRTEHFLVWDKEQTVDNFASAELAWCNLPCPAKVFHHTIRRHNKEKIGGHPTEKPVALMSWCIALAGDVKSILDPYAGSGTTGRAAKNLGRKSVLIEREERYCEIAAQRMAQEVMQFEEPPPGSKKETASTAYNNGIKP